MKHISLLFQIIMFALIIFSTTLVAQWTQVYGSYGGDHIAWLHFRAARILCLLQQRAMVCSTQQTAGRVGNRLALP